MYIDVISIVLLIFKLLLSEGFSYRDDNDDNKQYFQFFLLSNLSLISEYILDIKYYSIINQVMIGMKYRMTRDRLDTIFFREHKCCYYDEVENTMIYKVSKVYGD